MTTGLSFVRISKASTGEKKPDFFLFWVFLQFFSPLGLPFVISLVILMERFVLCDFVSGLKSICIALFTFFFWKEPQFIQSGSYVLRSAARPTSSAGVVSNSRGAPPGSCAAMKASEELVLE